MTEDYITDDDIRRAARHLAEKFSSRAQRSALDRADKLSQAGEHEAAAIWSRIAEAIDEAADEDPLVGFVTTRH